MCVNGRAITVRVLQVQDLLISPAGLTSIFAVDADADADVGSTTQISKDTRVRTLFAVETRRRNNDNANKKTHLNVIYYLNSDTNCLLPSAEAERLALCPR